MIIYNIHISIVSFYVVIIGLAFDSIMDLFKS